MGNYCTYGVTRTRNRRISYIAGESIFTQQARLTSAKNNISCTERKSFWIIIVIISRIAAAATKLTFRAKCNDAVVGALTVILCLLIIIPVTMAAVGK